MKYTFTYLKALGKVALILLLLLYANNTYGQGNDCSNPFVASSVPFSYSGTTCGFGDDYGWLDMPFGCDAANFYWNDDFIIEYTPTQTSCYTITSTGGVTVGIYDGCPDTGACITYPDGTAGLEAGTTYYIMVDSEDLFSSCNSFTLDINPGSSGVANDFCAGALPLTGDGSNYGATCEPWSWAPDAQGYSCNDTWSSNENGVWYTFTNDASQNVDIEIQNIVCNGSLGGTLQVGVWSNTGLCDLDAENFFGCLVANGNATLSLNNLPAGDYYLFADGSAGDECEWEFVSDEVLPPPDCTDCGGNPPPAEDECDFAVSLGSLNPPDCDSPGAGDVVSASLTGSNICATAENPYVYQVFCENGNDMASPAASTWYQVDVTGTTLEVLIDPAANGNQINNPNVGLWLDTGLGCGELQAAGCQTGSGGSLSAVFTPINPGTYYLQVSGGDEDDQCEFSMTLNNSFNCDICLTEQTFVADPPPENGFYTNDGSGITVEFCYTVSEYNPTDVNWLHGVVPTLGNGWDANSITPTLTPTGCNISGDWGWYNTTITGTGTGSAGAVGPGFFYETGTGDGFPCLFGFGCSDPSEPGDNYGDSDVGGGCALTFCWQVTSLPTCTEGANLGVSVDTYSDSETGGYSVLGCETDPNFIAGAVQTCCTEPTVSISGGMDNCSSNTSPITLTATTTGSPTPDIEWFVDGVSSGLTTPSIDVNPTASTTYEAVAINNCNQVMDMVVININESPTVDPTIAPIECQGDDDGEISLAVSGGTGAYNYTWSGPTAVGNVNMGTGLVPGTYDITVTDTGTNCETIVQYELQDGVPAPSIDAVSDPEICVDGESIDLDALEPAENNGTGLTGQWYTGTDNTGTAVSGSQTVNIGDQFYYEIGTGSCADDAAITVQAITAADASFDFDDYCDGATNGPTNIVTSGGTFAFNPVPSDGATIDAATGVITGGVAGTTYTVEYNTGGTCAGIATDDVTVTTEDDATFAVDDFCAGVANAASGIVTTGGTFTFNPVPSDGATIDGTTGEITGGVAGTTYTVEYTTAGTCSGSSTDDVTVTSEDDATFVVDDFCEGEANAASGIITTGGTFTFNPVPSDGATIDGTTGEITGGVAGTTYTVEYTTAGTCSGSSTDDVTVTSEDDATFAVDDFCEGAANAASGIITTGGTFTFNPVPSDGATIDGTTGEITGGVAGTTYTVEYTTAGTCSGSSTDDVTVTTEDDATFVVDDFCEGAANAASGIITTGGTFSFNPVPSDGATIDGTTGEITGGVAGATYTVEYTTAGTCSGSSTDDVTITSEDDATFAVDDFCEGAANAASGIITTGGTFSFNPVPSDGATIDGTTGEITGGVAGATYTVEYTTTGTCSGTSTDDVTVTTEDDATFVVDDFCEGAANAASGIITTGGTFSFNPVPSDGATIDGTTGEITGGVAGTTYTVEYITTGTCSGSSTDDVTVTSEDDATFAVDDFCEGAANAASGIITTGGTFSFNPVPSDGATIDGTTGEITGGVGGAIYTVEYTTVGTCSGTSTDDVTVTSEDDATFVVDDFCEGEANAASGIVTTGGTFTFNPIPSDGATIDGTTGEITSGVAGTTYTVEYTTAGTCSGTSTDDVTVTNEDDATFAVDDFCEGAANVASGIVTTGGTFTFNPVPSDGATIDGTTGEITGGIAGTTYTVEYITTGTCSGSSTDDVTVTAEDDATFVVDDFCEGESNAASGILTTGGTFSLNPAPTDGASINSATGEIINGVAGATYTVEYTTSGTCSATTTDDVTITAISAITDPAIELCEDVSGTASASGINLTSYDGAVGIGTVSWYNGDPDAGGTLISPADNETLTSSTDLWATIDDGNACLNKIQVSINVIGLPTINIGTASCIDADSYSVDITVTGGQGGPFDLSGTAITGANPTTATDGVAVTLTLDNAIADYTLSAVDQGGSMCGSEEYTIITPNCSCPTADAASIPQAFCAVDDSGLDLSVGGATGLANLMDDGGTLNTDDTDAIAGDGVEWFTVPAPVNGVDATYIPGSLSATDLCTSGQIELYAFLRCDLNGDGFNGSADDTYVPVGNISVYVFPDINVTETPGGCNAAVAVCPNYTITYSVSSDGANDGGTGSAGIFTADPDESGTVTFTITDPDTNRPASCNDIVVPVTFDCAADCPAEPILTADMTDFCGDGDVTFSTNFNVSQGSGSFDIVSNDGLGAVTAGTPFALPINETCDLIEYTFTATAICDGDGSTISELIPGDMSVTVTVYPVSFTPVPTEGDCGLAASISIQSANGTECDMLDGTAPTEPDCSVGGTNSSPLVYQTIFFDGTACPQPFDETVNADCTVPVPGVCDDNDCNTSDAYDAASCDCIYTPIPEPDCDDADCGTDDSYDAATCACVNTPIPEPDCDDADCGTDDSYDAATCACVNTPIPPPDCDDADCGTDDSYDAATCACVNTPIPEPDCDDADCGTDDSYDAATCACVNTPIPPPDCNDNDCLTADVYNIATCLCENNPIEPGACDDADCTTDDVYDVDLCECVFTPLPPPDCDDLDCGTDDSYDVTTCECINDPIEPLDCDDADCSTDDSYDAATCTCVNTPIPPPDCDDNDCSTEDSYDLLSCECSNTPLPPIDCDDGDCGTDDSYDAATCACINTPIPEPDCDDGDCGTDDSYDAVTCTCVNTPILPPDCNDDDCLTADVYNIVTCECENNPIEPGACDDSDCTTEDEYDVDLCECVFTPLPPPDCDDGDCGTDDSYDVTTCECINDPIEPLDCNDADCSTEDSYDTVTCECMNTPIPPPDCDDNDCNTEDSYDSATCECVNTPIPEPDCNDDDCTTDDSYNAATCECEYAPVEPLDCDDGDCLTADVYNIQTCECENNPIESGACDDGDCTTEDVYDVDLCECVYTPLPPPDCDDGDCGTDDSYNSLTCECINDPIEPLDCDDGDCATEDTYNAATCECEYAPVEPLDCDDGDCGTDDSYDATTCECVNTPIPEPDCNDDDCTTDDSYNAVTCECEYAPVEPLNCDDGDCLTADVYNIQTCECENNPIEPGACDDGDCTTEDVYDVDLCECVYTPLPPPDCDDGDCSTDDSYNSLTCECINDPIEPLDCDDGDCATEDTYNAISCECEYAPVEPLDCDDNDCSTDDSYNAATCECEYTPVESLDCDDNDCGTEDSYDAITCECVNTPIPPPNCDDGDCLTADVYNIQTCECEYNPIEPGACDDGDCTTEDSYNEDICECVNLPLPPPDCDDNDCGTEDSYNSLTCECINDPIEPPNCDDGDCGTDDSYDAATCTCINTLIPPPNCDDNDCGTVDSYDAATCECVNEPIESLDCDDDDCTTEDSYDPLTCTCINTPLPPLDCDDNDCGTEDSYDAATCECVNTPIPPPNCDDDDCGTDDSYDAATCECVNTPIPPPICDDGDCLTADVYNIQTCECEFNPIEPGACDDGDCTTDDSYNEDICECVNIPLLPPNCDDNDCNTEDSYDTLTCECINTPLPPLDCNDNDCNTEDAYDELSCSCINTPLPPPNCDDNNCNTEDSYDEATCSCINTLLPPPNCDDNDCTTEDSYDELSCSCINTLQPPLDCDDNNCNTEDSYDEATCSCLNTPIPPPDCNDDDCTTNDIYNSDTCECEYTPVEPLDCDDGDCLTADVYNIQTCECENNPIEPGACDDGDCTTEDAYDEDLCECVYVALPPPDCDDNDCGTADSYNSLTCECINEPIEPPVCDDGDCNTEDSYDEETCECVFTALPPPDCDDNNCTTLDSYDELTCSCINTIQPPPICDDEDCNTEDSYDAATCECIYTTIPPPDCDDDNCNTADSYDELTCSCVNTPMPPPDCDDDDCTTADSYDSDSCECVYEDIPAPDCDDGDCLTADVYNIQTCECENNPIEPGACDDGDCTTEDVYDEDLCECVYTDLPEPECDDNDCNTADSYDTLTCECINDPIPEPDCDDGDCGTVDSYDATTCECVYEAVEPGLCDDNDCNTADTYDETLCECVFTAIPPPDCDDDDCTTDDLYNSDTCECEYTLVEPLDCDDGDCLTADVYNIQTCECENNPIEPGACDDGDCTTEDVYDEDLCECVYTDLPEPDCNDDDCGTADSYDTETCECINDPIEPPLCDDNDCGTVDSYDPATCECVYEAVESGLCDDNDCNTEDTYDEDLCECVFTAIPPPDCDDDDCQTDDLYNSDTCECEYTPVEPLDCDDNDCLTADVYNIQTCECENNPLEPGACDDGDCTTEDMYDEDLCECVYTDLPPPDCNDNDCTTIDDYDSLTCECINDPIDPTIDATIDQTVVCDGATIALNVNFNADIDATVEWTLPDASTSTGESLTYTANSTAACGETQTIAYALLCADTGNLIDGGSFEISIYPNITATVTDGGCVASISQDCPDFTATWVDSDGNPGNGFEYVSADGGLGTVEFTVTNAAAPTDCASAIFIANYDCPEECTELDATTIAPTTDLCNDEAAFNLSNLLGTTATTGGTWSSPNAPVGTVSGNSFNPSGLAAGTYTVVYTVNPPITDPAFCQPVSSTQVIEVMEAPLAEVAPSVEVCNSSEDGITTINLSSLIINGDTNGTWTDLNASGATGTLPNIDFEGVAEGVYQFMYTVNAEAPCEEVSYMVSINVKDCSLKVAIPNAFSPNQDGVNDGFSVTANRSLEDFELHIFDRWGVRLYSTSDINDSWDGTYKGEQVDLGVYVYYCIVKLEGEEDVKTYKGNVTLVR